MEKSNENKGGRRWSMHPLQVAGFSLDWIGGERQGPGNRPKSGPERGEAWKK